MADRNDAPSLRESPRLCRTCRWWDMHSLAMKAGDCRAPSSGIGPHRYGRTLMPGGTYVLWDSFGHEETPPDYTCGAWDAGELPGARKDGSSPQNSEPSHDR